MREHYVFPVVAACLITVTATIMGLELAVLRVDPPYLILLPAVVVAFWIAGSVGGWVATLLSGLATWFFFIPPAWSFEINEYRQGATLLIFVASSGFVVTVLAHQRRTFEEMACSNLELRRRLLKAGQPDVGPIARSASRP